jgi:hypothetical protein
MVVWPPLLLPPPSRPQPFMSCRVFAAGGVLQESAQITFKPLYGAGNKHEPLCYLLCVDELTILLDCGWNDQFSLDTIAPLVKCVYRCSNVLNVPAVVAAAAPVKE